jgi:hypothetical protein
MSATTTVPVTIAAVAQSYIERSGQLREFELMIGRAKYMVPELMAIEVALDEPTEAMPHW